MSIIDDPEIVQDFQAEALDHLSAIEQDLLMMEESPEAADADCLDRVFRAIHTVKGSAGFLGFDAISKLCHTMETLLDRLRQGKMQLDSSLMGLLLRGIDELGTMLQALFEDTSFDVSGLVAELSAFLKTDATPQAKEAPTETAAPVPAVEIPVAEPAEEDVWGLVPKAMTFHYTIHVPDLTTLGDTLNLSPLSLYSRLESVGFVAGSELPSMPRRLRDVKENVQLSLNILFASEYATAQDIADVLELPVEWITPFEAPVELAEESKDPEPTKAVKVVTDAENTYVIRFYPADDVCSTPGALDALWQDLGMLGDCTVESLAAEGAAGAGYHILLTTPLAESFVRDCFIFVENGSRIEFDGQAAPRQPVKPAESAEPSESTEPAKPAAPKPAEKSTLPAKQHVERASEKLRVSSEKLDQLVNLVGEMVIMQAQLRESAKKVGDVAPELMSTVEGIERLGDNLRDIALSIRMTPVNTLFNKYRRLVRDLSKELGKKVHLEIVGADTELDKTVVDQLGDPLLHIIRNSLDHGLESPEKRVAAGKDEEGCLRIWAEQTGERVVIGVSDDGRGLNVEAIRAKAIERGLMGKDDQADDHTIQQMIFKPGFSTAQKVTGVSGRGVGMDVVKRQIDLLRGSIDLESTVGEGTTISFSLPLSLAIVDGLMVEVDADHFIIPMSMVTETIELTREQKDAANRRNVVNVRGELIPYIELRSLFDFGENSADLERVVILEYQGAMMGIVVDRVIGNHQTVLKSLGPLCRSLQAFSGATILGNGTVALILDVGGLVRLHEAQRKNNGYFSV